VNRRGRCANQGRLKNDKESIPDGGEQFIPAAGTSESLDSPGDGKGHLRGITDQPRGEIVQKSRKWAADRMRSLDAET